MLIKLTEVCTQGTYTTSQSNYALREIFVNPEHVVMIREESHLGRMNALTSLVEGLERGHSFSKLILDKGRGGDVVVVGSPATIREALNKTSQQLLRG